MADDKDDESAKKALEKKIANAISYLKNARSSTALDTALANMSDLPSEIRVALLQEAIEERNSLIQKLAADKNQTDDKQAKEAQEIIARLEKEKYEEEKQSLVSDLKRYDLIKDDLHKPLDENIDLIKKAADNPQSLTSEDNRKLKGQDLTEEEKEVERKKREAYKLHNQIIEKKEKTVEYANKKIKEIDKKIANAPNEKVKSALEKEKESYKNDIDLYKDVIEKEQILVNRKIDEERKELLRLAEHSPELAAYRAGEHYIEHEKKYEKAFAKDPHNKGVQELTKLIKKVGLEKDLDIDKYISQTPHQSNLPSSPDKSTISTKTTLPILQKNISIIDEITKTIKSIGKDFINIIKNIANKIEHELKSKEPTQKPVIREEKKLPLKPRINQVLTPKITPPHSPGMEKFANRGREIK